MKFKRFNIYVWTRSGSCRYAFVVGGMKYFDDGPKCDDLHFIDDKDGMMTVCRI